MTGLDIAKDLTLPIEMATDTSAILARKGAGKTYTGAVLFEEDVANGIPAVALDPMGAFWGLRASADGKSEGLPVTILGGEHGDAPLERTGGKLVADLVVEQPSWYVLDLSGLETNAAQDQFAADFAERLYRAKANAAQRQPLHLIIDEADSFAPQRAKGRERMLGAYEAIARRGRIRGIGSTFITQRPAVLNKNVLTQSEIVITLQITSPQDRKAVREWAEGHADKSQIDEYLDALASLKRGQAWVWSPSLDLFRQVQIRERNTFDSSATPKPGEKRVEPQRLAPVDVDRLRERMAETIEKAEATDPKKLQSAITALKRDLAKAQAEQPEPEVRIETVEVPVVPTDAVLALARVHEGLVSFCESLDALAGEVRPIAQELTRTLKEVEAHVDAPPLRALPEPRPARPKPTAAPPPAGDGVVALRAGARRLLAAVAQWPDGCTQAQAATVSGLKKTGGTFQTYLGDLKRAGYITKNGQHLSATPAGRDAAGVDEIPVHDPDAVLTHWRGHLRAGAVRMLDAIAAAGAHGIARDDLASEVEIEATGGTFSTYLGDLRRAGLIVTEGQTVALEGWLVA